MGGDHYVHLARSFAHGSLNVDEMSPTYRDFIFWGGHRYIPFAPLPAVLIIPLLPLFDAGMHLVAACYALTIVNLFILWRALASLGIADERRPWLLLLYFGGTMYLSVAMAGISTFFAHVVVTTFLLLAILETGSRSRPLLMGLFLGLAASARMTAAFALPFFLWMLWKNQVPGTSSPVGSQAVGAESSRVARVAMFMLGLAGPILLLAAYNYARFGDPAETGFGLAALYTPALDAARSKGMFSLTHVPKNLFMMLVQGPIPVRAADGVMLKFPFLTPSPWGMSLFLTSPALIYIFRAPIKNRIAQACWLAIALTLMPIVTYYGIGFVQFGYRYALDFMPFLILLVALGMPKTMTRGSRALIAASVAINIWGAIVLSVWI